MQLTTEHGEFADFLPFAVIIINPEKELKIVVMKPSAGAGYSTEEGIELVKELLGDKMGKIEFTNP